ncbi:MAG: LuxR C-terminal-related transcriptional regulator [Anaerolineales bacterium]
MTVLLATKLRQPVLPKKRIERSKLIGRLNEGLESGHQVFLVSAPAGFGKTTCISEWLDRLDWPVTWLSLDSSDDDPGRFFTHLLAALQKIDEHIGREIAGILHSGHLPPVEMISITLINDILDFEGEFLLVLDDFHFIQDRFILEFLETLVSNMPHPLHMVLITREDPSLPLAQLRANNLLTEIRASDLRFTSHDIGRFLKDVIGLSLSQADISTLEDKTEGWIVGLQLAGLSVRNQQDPSGFIANLSGSHRHILSYLTEQVLNQQSEGIRNFLLETSILEKLNGDLCNTVTGRSDGRAMLERLFNANLFLVPLDDEGEWYRYHHLFADLLRTLRSALHEEMTAELHKRASRWYAHAGMTSEAIQQALSARDYPMAVNLLEEHAMDMIMQGYAKTVNAWGQVIPDEWKSQSPRIDLAFAWAHVLRGAYAQGATYLDHLQTTQAGASSGDEDALIRAEWLVLQSLMMYMQGKTEECMDMATRALELAPERDSRVRSLAYYVQASVYWLMEEFSRAAKIYRNSIEHGRAAKNPVAEMMSTVGLAGMLLEHGQLHQAYEVASQAIERIERSGTLPPISAVVYALLGDVHYQRYQLEESHRYIKHALHLSMLGGANTVTVICHAFLARLYQIEGDLEAAAGEIQEAADLIPVDAPEYVRQEVVVQQVRIYLACNRLAAAEMALQSQGFTFGERFVYPELPLGESISYYAGLLYSSALRILLYQARAGEDPVIVKPGIELADRLLSRAFESQQLLVALEALLLRAQMNVELGNSQASQADYLRALELAAPEGIIGVFIEHSQPVAEVLADLSKRDQLGSVRPDYLNCILEAFSGTHPTRDEEPAPVSSAGTGPMTLIDPLTDRELEVLRLMAEGLKYKEIASELIVSLNTVRYHVKALYSKLNVNNRTQAIERARQLKIL